MRSLLVAVLVISPMVHATTYIVPTDAEMIAASKAIVVGTVVDSYARRAENGMIETVTRVVVEERIKGLQDERVVDVVQLGGKVGDQWAMLSGAPILARGEHLLLFLDRDERGVWRTYGLALGVFRFRGNMLIRGEEIFGWDRSGEPHIEEGRRAKLFLDYVRGSTSSTDYFAAVPRAHGPVVSHATYASSSYAIESVPKRRNGSTLTASWRLSGSVEGLDLPDAVDRGIAAWNGQNQDIHYSRSATPASGDTEATDGENRIIPNDPHDIIPHRCCGEIIAWTLSTGSATGATHVFHGEQFVTIVDSDITINEGMTAAFTQERLAIVMTHELGHSLGLRHSDWNGVDSEPCAAPLDCCSDTNDGGHCKAIMVAKAEIGISGLQAWDKRAIDCLFGGNCTFDLPCVQASIVDQPQNKTRNIGGGPATLQLSVNGTPPFTKQWYVGERGNTSTPIESDWDLRVSPEVTTSYWLRATGACGPPVDSNTATITVEPCPAVNVTSAYAINSSPSQVTLTMEATAGLNSRFTWYRGSKQGEGTAVGTRNVATVTLSEPATFWAKAENSCGTVAFSELVYAAPCGLPSIITQPSSSTIASGGTATLSVVLTAVGGNVAWYRGLPPDKSVQAGTGTSVVVGPLTTTTTFWGTVSNACGEIPIRPVTVNVSSPNRTGRGRAARP